MMKIASRFGVLDGLVGKTPLQKINGEWPDEIEVYAKLEGSNPGGSVKDRPALNMIRQAWEKGVIKDNTRLVEATSGNTGIGLAMVCAVLGLPITLVMPESATPERVAAMRAYGAEIILTDASKTIEYSRVIAEDLVYEKGYFMLDQFSNDDNWKAHEKSTGPEIWRDTDGQITHFVSSMGTTGTITGVSSYLKSQSSAVKIVGVQPKEGSSIPGIRKWSPEMIPKFYDEKRVDEIHYLTREDAVRGAKDLSRTQGIFCGISSGGAYEIVKKIINEQSLDRACIVFIVCDRGDRYLSTELV